jgi:hypothetical protein
MKCLPAVPLVMIAALAAVGAEPADFTAFQRDVSPAIAAKLGLPAKKYVQIEPAIHHLATQHAERLAAMSEAGRSEALVALARFIDRQRTASGARPVFAPGRTVIGLLDPDRGLDPKEITAIATAYGCETTIFKKDADDETIASVAGEFLAAVRDAAAADQPATIVVLGHGLPTEIQSYSIRFERLADALLEGAARRAARAGERQPLDLGHIVLICDDCFSADFLINLQHAVADRCLQHAVADRLLNHDDCRDRSLASLPVCIAGTNRDRVGFVQVTEKFVPHFWKDVVELYFIRRPLPKEVVLRNFFENVDHMMYGYGRAPIVEGSTVTGWRLVEPGLVQDPVTFVPLDDEARAELRTILDLPADAPLPRWLDIG